MKKINLLFVSLMGLIGIASAQGYGCGMMQGFTGSYGIGMMLFFWVFGIALLLALILLIVWLVKNMNKK